MPLGAILGAVGAGINLLSPLFNKKVQPTQINPLTDQRLADLMAQIAQYQPQFDALGGEAQSARQGQNQAAGQVGRLAGKSETTVKPSANAWFDQFLDNVPEYQAVAKQVSEMAMSQYGRDLDQQRAVDMEFAMRAAKDATAGQGFSGAAQAAAGQAAGSVIGQASLQRSQMASDIFNQTYNQLAGQGQGLAFQDQQMQFQNALSALSQAMGGFQGQAGIQGNVGAQALGQQQNVGALLNMLQGNVQDITQPVWSSPTTQNPLSGAGNAIGAMGQFIEGGQQQGLMANLLQALSAGSNLAGRTTTMNATGVQYNRTGYGQ